MIVLRKLLEIGLSGDCRNSTGVRQRGAGVLEESRTPHGQTVQEGSCAKFAWRLPWVFGELPGGPLRAVNPEASRRVNQKMFWY